MIFDMRQLLEDSYKNFYQAYFAHLKKVYLKIMIVKGGVLKINLGYITS